MPDTEGGHISKCSYMCHGAILDCNVGQNALRNSLVKSVGDIQTCTMPKGL
jgi:hypothetical protein